MRAPSASYFQPMMRVRGNQPRSSAMILGVGTSSTSRCRPAWKFFWLG